MALQMAAGDIYVAGQGCEPCPSGIAVYAPDSGAGASATLVDSGTGVYPGVRLSGQVWTDTVSMGPYQLENFTLRESIVSLL